jgi:hypothetical protein
MEDHRRYPPQMTGPMPTRNGDIVISHDAIFRSLYAVWRVSTDGQQARDAAAFVIKRIGRADAVNMAKLMARESRSAIYLVDSTSASWVCLSDLPR